MEQRLKLYTIGPAGFVGMMTAGNSITVTKGVPPGAELHSVYYLADSNQFALVFEHESFPMHEPGEPLATDEGGGVWHRNLGSSVLADLDTLNALATVRHLRATCEELERTVDGLQNELRIEREASRKASGAGLRYREVPLTTRFSSNGFPGLPWPVHVEQESQEYFQCGYSPDEPAEPDAPVELGKAA